MDQESKTRSSGACGFMKAPERISVLDGLRALAIILVLMRHSLKPFWPDISQPFLKIGPWDAAIPFLNGWTGVDLFFVLSGFLITRQLLKVHTPQGYAGKDLFSYLKRRFLRIAPAYYLVLTLVCLGLFPGFPHASSETVWGWRYIYHLLFLHDYWLPDICVVFWSLAIEMKFYLMAPFLLIILMRCPPVLRYALLAGLMVLMVVLRYMTVQGMEPFTSYEDYFFNIRNRFHLCLDGLLVGVACALLWSDTKIRNRLERSATANTLFFAGTGLILALLLFEPLVDAGVTLFDKTILSGFLSIGFGAMMLGLLGGSKGQNVFSLRPLAFIAGISYSLYLVHMPLIIPSIAAAAFFFGPQQGVTGWVLTLPFFLAFSGVAAIILYRFVEKPAMNWTLKT